MGEALGEGYHAKGMDLTEPVLLTPQGLDKLKAELAETRARRTEAADRMKEAAQPGDIEDNPEYEQAKEEVNRLDERIYELDEMIARAKIIEETHGANASAGSTIEVREEDGSVFTYQLVGGAEADPQSGMISIDSPVGKAVMGKRAGDKVQVSTPAGPLTLKVVKVS